LGDDGSLAVAWMTPRYDPENEGSDIYIRSFDGDGRGLVDVQMVNDGGRHVNFAPDIGITSDGGLIVTFTRRVLETERYDVVVQRYDRRGDRLGDNTLVNADGAVGSSHSHSRISMDRTGSFTIAWLYSLDEWHGDIRVQRFLSDGTRAGEWQQANLGGKARARAPALSGNGEGGSFVAWVGDTGAIFYQRFDREGRRVGTETRIAVEEAHFADAIDVSIDEFGHFILAWVRGAESSKHLYLHRFTSGGNPVGMAMIAEVGSFMGSPCVRILPDERNLLVYGAVPVDRGDGVYGTLYDCREPFIRGDANIDGRVNIADAAYILGALFATYRCWSADAMDANDDGELNIADPVYVLNFLFADGSPLPEPVSTRGSDPTPDDLFCWGR